MIDTSENEILDNLPEPPITPFSDNIVVRINPDIKVLDMDGILCLHKDEIDNKIFCSSNMVSFLLTPDRFNPKFRESSINIYIMFLEIFILVYLFY